MYSGGNQLQITAETVLEFIQKMVSFYTITTGKRPKYCIISELTSYRLKNELRTLNRFEAEPIVQELKQVYGLQVVITYDKKAEKIEFGY